MGNLAMGIYAKNDEDKFFESIVLWLILVLAMFVRFFMASAASGVFMFVSFEGACTGLHIAAALSAIMLLTSPIFVLLKCRQMKAAGQFRTYAEIEASSETNAENKDER